MNEIVTLDVNEVLEKVLIKGDLSALNAGERITFYKEVCKSIGLNWLTRPLEYMTLNNRLVLYAKKDCTDQLRKMYGVSIEISDQQLNGNIYIVTVKASDKTGRVDSDLGAVSIPEHGAAEIRANLIMKAITKAKRRVTLSICGLGFLDETEVEDIPREAKKAISKAKEQQSDDADLGDHQLTYENSRLESPADPADAPSPSVPPSASAGLSQPAQMYAAQMDKAAEQGLKRLSEMWAKLHPRYQKELEHMKAEWKVTAQAADAKKAKKSDTLV